MLILYMTALEFIKFLNYGYYIRYLIHTRACNNNNTRHYDFQICARSVNAKRETAVKLMALHYSLRAAQIFKTS